MKDLRKKIAVLIGGTSSEREVSLATGRGVSKALRSLGMNVVDVDVRDENFKLPGDVHLAFVALHGTFGEGGQIQQLLERPGVAYTGEGTEESRLAFDKIRAKEKFLEHGVQTPEWETIHVDQCPRMQLPIVIKPPQQGSTVGIHIVRKQEELAPAIADAAKYDCRLLIEKFVSGRELTIGILGEHALPILEIVRKGGFYDFNNKYPFLNPQADGGAEHVCPARIDEKKTAEIQNLALQAFHALGLRVWGRVDVILSDSGEPFVLEVNTIPGMTEASLLPESVAAAGIGYADLCARIIALSRFRHGYDGQARARIEGKR